MKCEVCEKETENFEVIDEYPIVWCDKCKGIAKQEGKE